MLDSFRYLSTRHRRQGRRRGGVGVHRGGSNVAATGGRVSTMATRSFDAR